MSDTVHPEVLWAQRSSDSDPDKNYIYLTITMPDVPADSLKLDIQPTYVEASGHSTTKNLNYKTKLELFAEIDPAKTKKNHTDRDLELVLYKKELKQEYWPRLLKEKGKVHFLRTDFDKWVDEDEQDGNADDDDFMSKMGGMGGGPGGFEDIDFSKLGAGPDATGDDEDGDESDDEEMPDLEGQEKEVVPSEEASKEKTEEAA
ncbi:uncharacterized protein PV09_02363 [Verruconis gallopava]|uniref:CS domain-containing protein n=1 Tax=Verruconis gallopava TaxID=253628 RepID=A0A0D2AJB5_9PEZI|nr:uncharacterized protein PV09_02363 [Verruconis gallopava]KIW06655.1 hypothetical protein PV09_02363 [Verruconis gallopava]